MPARSPVQCRSTVARQLPVRRRIADLGSDRGLGGHPRASDGQARRLNSYVGPLESRRRMGKRHMTGTIPSITTHQPFWPFAVPTSGDAWKWEAPTTASQRKEKSREIRPAALFNRLIQWLESPTADEHYLQSPPSDIRTRLGNDTWPLKPKRPDDADIAFIDPARSDSSPDIPLPPPPSIEELPQEVIELRRSVCSPERSSSKGQLKLASEYCDAIKKRIKNGQLSAIELNLYFNPFDQNTMDQVSHAVIRKLTRSIRRSIVQYLAAFQATSEETVHPDLWLALADQICTLDMDSQTPRLFKWMMDGMPAHLTSQLGTEQLYQLICRFLGASAEYDHNMWTWWTSARSMSGALRRLTATQQKDLDDRLQIHVLQDQGCYEQGEQLRFAWLITKAYNPSLTLEMVMDTYRLLMAKDKVLTDEQLWVFVSARLIARGVVVKGAKCLTDNACTTTSSRWRALLSSVLGSKDGEAGREELKILLRETGGFHVLADRLTSPPPSKDEMDVVQALAVIVDDHKLAYGLWEKIRAVDEDRRLTMAWRWEAWIPYVERMIKDPELEECFWHTLHLRRDIDPRDTAPKPEVIAAKRQLLHKMAVHYIEATHLNERQLLRRLDLCATLYRVLTNGISMELIALLTDVITRDLERGEWGRTARLLWVVEMVAENDGPEAAERTRASIREWRRVIDWARRNLPQDTFKRS